MDKNRKEEFFRRMTLLGLEGTKFVDIGASRIGEKDGFYPVDPDAEPLHPDWERTTDRGGGAYAPNGAFFPKCHNQFCDMPCGCCERNLDVLINGRKGLKYVADSDGKVEFPDTQDYNRKQNPRYVFDWNMAAELISPAANKPDYKVVVRAGLPGHMKAFSHVIFKDGEPVFPKYPVYASQALCDSWAKPCIEINGKQIPCYKEMLAPTPFQATWWPEEALKILRCEMYWKDNKRGTRSELFVGAKSVCVIKADEVEIDSEAEEPCYETCYFVITNLDHYSSKRLPDVKTAEEAKVAAVKWLSEHYAESAKMHEEIACSRKAVLKALGASEEPKE